MNDYLRVMSYVINVTQYLSLITMVYLFTNFEEFLGTKSVKNL